VKRIIAVFLIAVFAFSVGNYQVDADNKAFHLFVSCPTVYKPGDSLNVTISVYDIKLEGGMSYVSFRLYYDGTKVVPLVKNGFTDDSENRSTFIVNCPDFESWEVIGILDEKECFYELTFGTESVFGLKTAKADNSLVFSVPFTVPVETKGDIRFTLPEDYIRAGNAKLTQREVPGGANDVVVKDSSFSYKTGVNNISDTSTVSVYGDKPLSVLSDGDKVMAASSGNDAGVVLFQNLKSYVAGTFPSVELMLMLESEKTINHISICFFYDFDSGIGLPKDKKMLISYSPDSTSFSQPVEYNLNLDVGGTKGVAEAIIKLDKPEKIKYLKLTFAFGEGLKGANAALEFLGMTELSAYYISDSEEADPFELTSSSKYKIEGGYLLGVPDNVTPERIKSNFKREVTVNGTGTGSIVTAGDKSLVIIVAGEVDGDGIIDSIDYLLIKKACLGNLVLSPAELKAACIEGGPIPTSFDVYIVKKHILGTDAIHDHS
jgi:hypothetical protein